MTPTDSTPDTYAGDAWPRFTASSRAAVGQVGQGTPARMNAASWPRWGTLPPRLQPPPPPPAEAVPPPDPAPDPIHGFNWVIPEPAPAPAPLPLASGTEHEPTPEPPPIQARTLPDFAAIRDDLKERGTALVPVGFTREIALSDVARAARKAAPAFAIAGVAAVAAFALFRRR